MSNFDKNMREPVDQTGFPRSGFSSRSIAAAGIVVVLILIAAGYVIADRSNTGPSAPSPPAATMTAPATPAPTGPASPETAPKP